MHKDVIVPEGNRIQLVSSQADVSDYDAIVSHLEKNKGGITVSDILAIDDQKREIEKRKNFRFPKVNEEDMPIIVPNLEGAEEGREEGGLLVDMTREEENEDTLGVVLIHHDVLDNEANREESAWQENREMMEEVTEVAPVILVARHGEEEEEKEKKEEDEQNAITVNETTAEVGQESPPEPRAQTQNTERREKRKGKKKKSSFVSPKDNIVSPDFVVPIHESSQSITKGNAHS